jgi:hypothetical protein
MNQTRSLLECGTRVSAGTAAHAGQRFAKAHIDKASCLSARRRECLPAGLTAASLRPTPADRHEALSRQPTEYLP